LTGGEGSIQEIVKATNAIHVVSSIKHFSLTRWRPYFINLSNWHQFLLRTSSVNVCVFTSSTTVTPCPWLDTAYVSFTRLRWIDNI